MRSAESATGPGGLPKARTSREFLIRSARNRIQCTRAAAQEGTEPGTEEGRQADPVSRSKSAQKRRQHKRIERDYSAYCLMHASLKQSLRGTSSGSPSNALHSLVIEVVTQIYFPLPVNKQRKPITGFNSARAEHSEEEEEENLVPKPASH